MNEAETRAEYIDPALKAAGWGVVDGSRIRRNYAISPGRIEGQGRRGNPLFADYVLEYRNTKLAIVEAKAWNEELTEGVAQAKNYAGKMAIRYTYSTNGQGIYGIDMETGKEGELPTYPTPDELWNVTFAVANGWRDRFAAVPFEDKGGTLGDRYFRDIAIARVLEAIALGQQRILLTLATGTGKTMIAFQVAWKLFQSRWNLTKNPRAGHAFSFSLTGIFWPTRPTMPFSFVSRKTHGANHPGQTFEKKGRVPTNGSLFFTIFQTFMSGPLKDGDPSPYFGDYPLRLLRFHRYRRVPSRRRQR